MTPAFGFRRWSSFLKSNYAPTMIKIKKEIFGAEKNSTGKLVKEMDEEELYRWMVERCQAYDQGLRGDLAKESF